MAPLCLGYGKDLQACTRFTAKLNGYCQDHQNQHRACAALQAELDSVREQLRTCQAGLAVAEQLCKQQQAAQAAAERPTAARDGQGARLADGTTLVAQLQAADTKATQRLEAEVRHERDRAQELQTQLDAATVRAHGQSAAAGARS